MGNNESKAKRDAVKEFSSKYNLGDSAMDALYEKFKAVDRDGSGKINAEEFYQSLALDGSDEDKEFAMQMFTMFDDNESGEIDFREFVILLSNFTSQGNVEEKRAFAFQLYDYNNDGTIDKDEFLKILRATLSLSEKQIEEKASAVFDEADSDGDGSITWEEFVLLSEKYPEYLDSPFNAVFNTHFYI